MDEIEAPEQGTESWVLYRSEAFTVWCDRLSGVHIGARGRSEYLQGEEAGKLQDDVSKLEAKWADDDAKRVEFTDHLLSQYFF